MNKSTKRYRIRNWGEYNQSLCNRGSLTIWIDEAAITEWYNSCHSGKRGASDHYSDLAIECLLILRSVYHLPLRQVTGFAGSIFSMMGLALEVPHYSTLSRRSSGLDVYYGVDAHKKASHIVIDSTGLKVYGQGEWHARAHGVSKRRVWRKLHIAVDESRHEIVASVSTGNAVVDSEVFEDLLGQIEGEIAQVSADGAYDTWSVYDVLQSRGIRGVIPPRRGSRIKQHGNSGKSPIDRDEHIRFIHKYARKRWKRESGYHRRSIAETAMSRYKGIFGERLRSRGDHQQQTEMLLQCSILNRMTALGMPESYALG